MHVLALLRDHSGTVMDLPYKFGATDRDVTREENFNMEIIREGVRPKKMSKDEYQAAVKEAKERQRQKEKEKRKEEKKRAEREASGRPVPNWRRMVHRFCRLAQHQKHVSSNPKRTMTRRRKRVKTTNTKWKVQRRHLGKRGSFGKSRGVERHS